MTLVSLVYNVPFTKEFLRYISLFLHTDSQSNVFNHMIIQKIFTCLIIFISLLFTASYFSCRFIIKLLIKFFYLFLFERAPQCIQMRTSTGTNIHHLRT